MNNLSESAIRIFKPNGEQCESCRSFFSKLTKTFTNRIGFKDLCDKCNKKNKITHNNNINTFPSKIEFDKRRVI